MKFSTPKNLKKWTKEETETQIKVVENEISDFNREMNAINSKLNALYEEMRIIQYKISHKHRYITQLKSQIKVTK